MQNIEQLDDVGFEAAIATLASDPPDPNLRYWGDIGLTLLEKERLIRAKEACVLLGVSRPTLYRMIQRGDLIRHDITGDNQDGIVGCVVGLVKIMRVIERET